MDVPNLPFLRLKLSKWNLKLKRVGHADSLECVVWTRQSWSRCLVGEEKQNLERKKKKTNKEIEGREKKKLSPGLV